MKKIPDSEIVMIPHGSGHWAVRVRMLDRHGNWKIRQSLLRDGFGQKDFEDNVFRLEDSLMKELAI